MANRKPMTEEHKAKLAAAREARKAQLVATGEASAKKASIEEQIAAVTARADAGDVEAINILPSINYYNDQLQTLKAKVKEDMKTARKRLRKTLNTLKD